MENMKYQTIKRIANAAILFFVLYTKCLVCGSSTSVVCNMTNYCDCEILEIAVPLQSKKKT